MIRSYGGARTEVQQAASRRRRRHRHFRDGQIRHQADTERLMVVPYPIPRRCAPAYFAETNVVVPIGSVAAGSNQPASKSVIITIE